MNKLALFLNSVPLTGSWHFALGTRFDQTVVAIDFDSPGDLHLAQSRYNETENDKA